MIGRERELTRLRGALDSLQGGAGAVVAIAGEPGIGKSRLLRALEEDARSRGMLVLAGRTAEFEGELPYGALVDALDQHLRTLDDTRLRGLDTEQLAGVFPAFADLGAPATPALAVERYRAHRAVLELLARLAATKPLVLTLDDMHDADPASAELLLALLRRPPGARVLVAIAMRSARIPPVLADRLGAAQREGGVLRIDLGPLDPDEALALIGTGVPTAQREAVLRESGGNPFYVEQLVRAGGSDGGLPGTVAEAIGGELRSLEPQSRRLLEGAAVAGDPFEPDLAAAAAQLGEHEALELLDGLLESGLVRETRVPRQFTFRHPLVRRAVYEGAGGGWRLAAHARVAAALEQRGAAPEQLAHHIEFSAPHGDERAIAVLRAAGDAVRAQTPATAARWYGAALRLVTGPRHELRRSLLRGPGGRGVRRRAAGGEPPRAAGGARAGARPLQPGAHPARRRVRRRRALARPPRRGAPAAARRAGRARRRGRRARSSSSSPSTRCGARTSRPAPAGRGRRWSTTTAG